MLAQSMMGRSTKPTDLDLDIARSCWGDRLPVAGSDGLSPYAAVGLIELPEGESENTSLAVALPGAGHSWLAAKDDAAEEEEEGDEFEDDDEDDEDEEFEGEDEFEEDDDEFFEGEDDDDEFEGDLDDEDEEDEDF